MVANLQAGFSNSLPVIKIDVFIFFRYKFHWNLFPWVQIYIDQHWSGQLLSTEQATSHYFEPMTTQPTDTKYWGQNRMVANLQAAFSNSLPVIKIDVFNFCPIYISLKSFPMSPKIYIDQHWSWQLLGTEQAISHYFEPMTTQPADTYMCRKANFQIPVESWGTFLLKWINFNPSRDT